MALTNFSGVSSLPTNYEYFASGGAKNGLSVNGSTMRLNDKEVFIYSGAMHYFRVPRPYWRDRLKKIRAAGLNTVETYVPWNLHEPRSGEFDFGDKDNDMSDFLNLQEFLTIAKEEDLFAIVRPGPYICAEFESGGFPSWLLRENDIDFRNSNPTYMKYVTRWFNLLLPILAMFQFTRGGPIIAFQVENEYALSGKHDLDYLRKLRQLMLDNGIKELLVTSDNPPRGTFGTIPELFFMTGNFNQNVKPQLDTLKSLQPGKPVMVMEYWAGWYDAWGSRHSNFPLETFKENYEIILSYPASVNIYMFHGGTNFGFLNGASNNILYDDRYYFRAVTTSYDYLSPLNEAGNYTDKYWAVKELLQKYNKIKTLLPEPPVPQETESYPAIGIEQQLSLGELLSSLPNVTSKAVLPMEKLDVNNHNGQSYGYIVYRKTNVDIPANGTLLIEGRVFDTVMVLVNGVLVSPWLEKTSDLNRFGSYLRDSSVILSSTALEKATIDIVVENWGRVNNGIYKQYKGLWQGGVKLNDAYLYDWTIFPLEFQKKWTNSLNNWQTFDDKTVGPCLFKANLQIAGTPKDTFVYMENWKKGIVIVNGFVLGRYARLGPTQTVFLPATLLKQGSNTIYIFEHFRHALQVEFSKTIVNTLHYQ
ncbi:unnamed protein product [Acanthoscelides obtectus]|uniref:Beta-galactosidase n=3 Tax=Acanthoscelides obtectus TaxID=200917 RepID=A0A9P0L060_ACAOB|nr:unnamed protein product [Acanthoscelides obtectus]CAK1688442.1 Beta-galactosidase-1-like protein 2 [Acanthoscelides obtectus]